MQILYGMSVPIDYKEQLYFHALFLLSQKVGLKNLRVMQNTVSDKLADMAVLL